MDKFCLKWNEFEGNIRESFKKLRTDQVFADVTLATEDGRHVKAHKIILSAGSYFFSDIFVKSNHSNMLIYLKGITFVELEPVINFLYMGEATVAQEEIERFLETGKVLKVKGLDSRIKGRTGEGTTPVQSTTANYSDSVKDENENAYIGDCDISQHETFTSSRPIMSESRDEDNEVPLTTVEEHENQREEMFEKVGRVWSCKVCGKAKSNKRDMRRHAETHIDVVHASEICSKTLPTTSVQSTTANYSDGEYVSDCDIMKEETFTSSRPIMSESRDEDNEVPLITVEEYENQREKMFEKVGRVWSCKECGRTMPNKTCIRRHAETHIDVVHASEICS